MGCALWLGACGSSQTAKPVKPGAPLSAALTREYQACKVDDDCVYTRNGCCDCANGGEAIAVARTELDRFRSQFACDDVLCTMMGAEPPCDAGKATCEEGLCRYQPATP